MHKSWRIIPRLLHCMQVACLQNGKRGHLPWYDSCLGQDLHDTLPRYTCIRVYAYVHMHTCMTICMCKCIDIHVSIHIAMYTYMCVYYCRNICIYVYMHIYMHIYICMTKEVKHFSPTPFWDHFHSSFSSALSCLRQYDHFTFVAERTDRCDREQSRCQFTQKYRMQ